MVLLKIATTFAAVVLATNTYALSVSPAVPDASTANDLASALLADNSGISITAGSQQYIGADNQGGTFTDFSVSNSATTISLPDGVVLTTGDASIINRENQSLGFGAQTGTGSNAALTDLLATRTSEVSETQTSDQNVLSFSFTADPGITSVSASFVFGTEEFPNQDVTDIFGFFVDGVNFAAFSDGSFISFDENGPSAAFYNDNDLLGAGFNDPFVDFEYDGITDALTVTGFLDETLSEHTIIIAIADTFDDLLDSGVFIGGLTGGFETEDGGFNPSPVVAAVPLPGTIWLFLAGFGVFGYFARRRTV